MSEPARHTGGPRGLVRGPRRAGRTGLAALAGGCALALLGAVVAPQALAAPTLAGVTPDFPVAVSINSVEPTAPGANGTLVVSGQVTNGGTAPVRNAHAGLLVGGRTKDPLSTRSDIDTMLARTTPTAADGRELDNPTQQLNDLAPGASAPFTLQVSMGDLKLDQGVYELAVDVQGGTQDDDSTHQVGIARSLLPYFPDPKDTKPTQIGTLWPLTHAPELVAQTVAGNDTDQTPVLRDDSLATELAPGGRLDQLVRIGATVPSLTWVIDPDLLDTVYAMTQAYRVQQPGHGGEPAKDDNTTPGKGQAVATAWLNELRAAVTKNGDEVVALPYADPDLASIAHNGQGLAGLDTALGKASTAGKVTVEGRLSVDVRNDVAWPYQGELDQEIAGTAQKLGDSLVLVNGTSLPDSPSLAHTPNAARPIGDNLTAVVADSGLSAPFQSDLSTQAERTLAEQRFLAQSLAITQEQPNNQRSLLVMPPRELTANTAQALADSLKDAQNGKWTTPATLDAVASAPADPGATTTVPGADSYPGDLRSSELTSSDFAAVSTMQQGVDQLLRILTVPQRVSSPFGAAMVRSVSTGWRDQQSAGTGYRLNVRKYLDQLTSAVSIPAKSKIITLPGDSGLLQVSVKNDLNQTVENLQLRLTSGQPNRLKVSVPVPVVLGAAHSNSLRFTAQAKQNGLVPMTAQLWTVGPDAQPYGPAVQFNVEVTKVPSGVWWVVGAGGVLVLLAGARIYLQRKKQDGEPEDPDAPLVPDAADRVTDQGTATAQA
ncbi:DUF6049 family protein [Kitasatospora sp. NPDC052896]|uniref:DUF6049 family protein n=1 Tax=Kitasatospora sp. NPDC052896 TaxID=3364061 RepID=UPI0037C76533